MSASTVSIGFRSYTVTPDLPGRETVFIVGTILDDVDRREIAREATVTTDIPLAFTSYSRREFALAGNPESVFADSSIAHTVTVSVDVKGYRDLEETITVPALPVFPHRHDIALRRLPKTISGRVFGLNGAIPPSYDPIDRAIIALVPTPGSGGELPLLLRQPLRATPTLATTIRGRTAAAQTPLTVIADASSNQAVLAVDDGSVIAVGDLIRGGSERHYTYSEIAQILPHPDLPAPAALLRMTEALVGPIPNGSVVARLRPGPFAGPAGNFVGQAFEGEAVIWLDTLPDTMADILVVSEIGNPDRYHDANALTGSQGDYRITGFARIGDPEFSVSATGFSTTSNVFAAARIGAGPLDWYLAP